MRTIPDAIKPELYRLYGRPLEIYELYLNSPYTTPSHRYVANNEDISFGGYTYTALAVKRTAIKSEDGTIINEVEVGLDNVDLYFRNLMAAGTFDRKRCVIKMVFANILSSSSYYVLMLDGFLDEPKGDDKWATMTVRPFPMFEREYPSRIFQVGCNYMFCDISCTLTLANYAWTGTLASGCTTNILYFTSDVFGTKPPDYCYPGYVEIMNGDMIGQVRPIIHSGTVDVQVRIPFDTAPVAGVSVKIQKLCRKDYTHCKAYINYANFGGFPHVPKKPTY